MDYTRLFKLFSLIAIVLCSMIFFNHEKQLIYKNKQRSEYNQFYSQINLVPENTISNINNAVLIENLQSQFNLLQTNPFKPNDPLILDLSIISNDIKNLNLFEYSINSKIPSLNNRNSNSRVNPEVEIAGNKLVLYIDHFQVLHSMIDFVIQSKNLNSVDSDTISKCFHIPKFFYDIQNMRSFSFNVTEYEYTWFDKVRFNSPYQKNLKIRYDNLRMLLNRPYFYQKHVIDLFNEFFDYFMVKENLELNFICSIKEIFFQNDNLILVFNDNKTTIQGKLIKKSEHIDTLFNIENELIKNRVFLEKIELLAGFSIIVAVLKYLRRP
ncbi:hypothetical protein GVAV_000638 [Gurleya vavrai]